MKRLFKYPWLNIAIILMITLFFIIQLPKLVFDNDAKNFVPDNDPALIALEECEEQFGSVVLISLVVTSPYGSLLDEEGLNVIRNITEKLQTLDGQEDVQSLINYKRERQHPQSNAAFGG